MSPKSGYSVQIACTNLLSCLKGHFLTACYCSFQREDSSHPTSIVSVGYHVTTWRINCSSSQSGGGIKYTDCISAERQDPTPMSVLDMALSHLIVRLQSWSFGECRVLLHCHYFQVHWSGVVVPDRVLSIGQIELVLGMIINCIW